jgi:dihydrofolate synthase/folylpolyglutamate synthase
MTMTALEYLLSLETLGIKFGLRNIRALTDALGRPDDAFRSVIVAGTNGKGSVAAMTERGLRAAGCRTGLYISPHLVRLEERFLVGGAPVPADRLESSAERVRTAIGVLRANGILETEPTFFEATTAVALEAFRRAGVEVAVLEVGMGGRFDATNVVTPVAAAITTIDLDHESFLGHTRAEIAFEKAGVIKPGTTVVAGPLAPEALAVVRAACEERGAELVIAAEHVRAEARLDDEGRAVLELATPRAQYGAIRLALRGMHQAANAVVAVRLLEGLAGRGVPLTDAAVRAALADVEWKGRLQVVPLAGTRLVLDGAHNPAGAAVLADYLRAVHPGRVPLVFGLMRDKDARGMLERLLPRAAHLVITSPPTPRAADPPAVAATARSLAAVPLEVVPDPVRAVARARELGPVVCVAGSLYLIGAVLGAIERGALA